MGASREISEGYPDIYMDNRCLLEGKRRVLTCKTASEFGFFRGKEAEDGFVASA